MSDIVFLRAWYPVQPVQYYNPVASLLASGDVEWTGMRLTRDVRRDTEMRAPRKHDSLYTKVERAPRRFNPLKVPKGLQKELPFAAKPKLDKKRTKPTLDTRRAVVMDKRESVPVCLSIHLAVAVCVSFRFFYFRSSVSYCVSVDACTTRHAH